MHTTTKQHYPPGQKGRKEDNKLRSEDRPAHDWYRFVLSFPPHLVREYIERFGVDRGQVVLDPFCGTGTTLVECKKLGIVSIGIEPNPVANFASRVKTDWKTAVCCTGMQPGLRMKPWHCLGTRGLRTIQSLLCFRPNTRKFHNFEGCQKSN